jgi:hypothetical protein
MTIQSYRFAGGVCTLRVQGLSVFTFVSFWVQFMACNTIYRRTGSQAICIIQKLENVICANASEVVTVESPDAIFDHRTAMPRMTVLHLIPTFHTPWRNICCPFKL